MKKKTIWIGAALASLLLLSGIAAAQRYGKGFGMQGAFHEQMEEVMEEGSYAVLVELREGLGFNMMPWVSSEEACKKMQEHHETMEKYHEENGYGPGMGMGMHGKGLEGCPMMG